MAEYVKKEDVLALAEWVAFYTSEEDDYEEFECIYPVAVSNIPAADVVEVVQGYHEGDVCIYGYGADNKSRAIVEIVKILNDERGVAEVKFLKVFVDDTGNGLFNYLLKSGKTMNASFQYLKNITPRKEGE